ncbi:hypothetical protein GQ57_38475 [Burkholderia sp. MSh2]|nr:hypothetical protein GQ57_38475 [Burkholderia sp. MSh2]
MIYKRERTHIEHATNELGMPLSRRTINKYLACIDDAIERRKDLAARHHGNDAGEIPGDSASDTHHRVSCASSYRDLPHGLSLAPDQVPMPLNAILGPDRLMSIM